MINPDPFAALIDPNSNHTNPHANPYEEEAARKHQEAEPADLTRSGRKFCDALKVGVAPARI